jgi:hypothetical protein
MAKTPRKQPQAPRPADQNDAPVETSSGVSATPSTKPKTVEKTKDGLTVEHY